jgi:hypothetical protein
LLLLRKGRNHDRLLCSTTSLPSDVCRRCYTNINFRILLLLPVMAGGRRQQQLRPLLLLLQVCLSHTLSSMPKQTCTACWTLLLPLLLLTAVTLQG